MLVTFLVTEMILITILKEADNGEKNFDSWLKLGRCGRRKRWAFVHQVSADRETERQQEPGSRHGSHDLPPGTHFLQKEPPQRSSTTSPNSVTLWGPSAQTLWEAFLFNYSNSTKILLAGNQERLRASWVY